MNTTKLKPFAQQARKILMEGVRLRLLFWGFDGKDNDASEPEAIPGGVIFRNEVYNDPGLLAKWQQMKTRIGSHTFADAIEEAAYTWFNRLMAIKILEKNGYEQKQLDYEGTVPALLDNARNGIMPFLGESEKQKVRERLLAGDEEGAFGILLTGYCRKNSLLNRVFGGIDDFTELLLPNNLLTKGGIIELLNLNGFVLEEDYKQVELIGWLYQFYISEKKDEVFKGFKENKKARKEDIPAATQIFTPKWIVKYLVENTVGQTWLDQHPDSEIKTHLKYLVENKSKKGEAPKVLSPGADLGEAKKITLLDPAVGSGHILVTAFDVYMLMYREEGSTTRQAVREILKYNLFGLDIDKRAAQLARFAVLMKAASYDREVLSENVLPQIYAMPEPVHFDRRPLEQFLFEGETLELDNEGILKDLNKGLLLMRQAQNLGSIIQFDLQDDTRDQLWSRYRYWVRKEEQNKLTIDQESWWKPLSEYLNPLNVLLGQYDCVAANPPYMGQKNMNGELKEYVNKHYPDSKADLFAVFMEACWNSAKTKGRVGMINQHSWMFLSSFEGLRSKVLNNHTIESMLHLGPRTFEELSGEVVQSTAFVLRNGFDFNEHPAATYYRLVDYRNIEEKHTAFQNNNNVSKNISQSQYFKIPGSPIAYWVSKQIVEAFQNEKIGTNSFSSAGIRTGKDSLLIRDWYEVNLKRINLQAEKYSDIEGDAFKWFPITRGGEYKRWFGNYISVIDLELEAKRIKEICDDYRLREKDYYFKPGITWTMVSSNKPSFRFVPQGIVFGNGGPTLFNDNIEFTLAYLNTKIAEQILGLLNPTLNCTKSDVENIPFIVDSEKEKVVDASKRCISISKRDWNGHEYSWAFNSSPLIKNGKTIRLAFTNYHKEISSDFTSLHSNEEELNRFFIKLYGLSYELSPEVELHDITILQDEVDYLALKEIQQPYVGQLVPIKKDVVMQQFISYAIGLLLGRYRLDKPGLNIAHPEPSAEELSSYKYNGHQFVIDEDAIIPLLGEESPFADNLVKRFKDVLVAVWGEETQTENINFLNECLGIPFEKFLTEKFWDYHKRVYQKKPIYWLFTSPAGSFKVLVYMHRMDKFTVQKIRLNYLHRYMEYLGNEVQQAEANGTATRTVDKLNRALQDCREYDKILKPLADQQIVFDLDDGVTVNYAKFKPAVAILK
jgi:hypothetical protein